ncbi:diacylglycerol/lipid kinase family protein [Pseudonocardia kongjuensis]
MPDGPSGARPSTRRRLAAALALAALVAAAALVVLALLTDPLAMVAGVLLVVLAVLAGWTALVRRGARRAVAAVVAVAALLSTVGVLLLAGSVLRLVAVVVLVPLATAAARVAIGRDLAPEPSAARAVGPARSGVLLMNPRSGGGKVGRYDLMGAARRIGVRPVLLRPGDDLRALAEQAVAGGADVLGMAGGDGSQALVADVAHRHGVAFVCVPAGTRNHFALDLGLDRADVPAALDAFGAAVERRIDLALVGDRVFVNNASLGAYAAVVRSEAYREAKLATAAAMLPDLLGPDARRPDLRFTGPGGELRHTSDVLLVSNGAYRLSRLNGFGTRERIDGGRLGVVAVTVDRARDLTTLLAAEAGGRLDGFRGYRAWTVPEFEVRSADPLLDVAVDGETLQLPPPLRFRSLPGALRVRTPVDAPGAAPAAAAPAGVRDGVTALFRVLRGRPAR